MIIDELPRLPPAEWSICLRDLASDQILTAYRAENQLRTASIGKILLLIEVARQFESGQLEATEPLRRSPGLWIADSGLWYRFRTDTLPATDVAMLVGAVSDNLATNVLLERIGMPAIVTRTQDLGMRHTALMDSVRAQRGPADPPTLSLGTAGELSLLLARLQRDEIVSPGVCAQVREWLAADTDLSMVASAFGLDPLAHTEPDRGVTLINKTGTMRTVRADIGVVGGPRGAIAYAVVANWTPGAEIRDQVLAAMAQVGWQIRAAIGADPG